MYFFAIILHNVAELSRNKASRNGIEVEIKHEKFTVMCSRSLQNLEFSHFTLLFGGVQRRNKAKFIRSRRAFAFSLHPIIL